MTQPEAANTTRRSAPSERAERGPRLGCLALTSALLLATCAGAGTLLYKVYAELTGTPEGQERTVLRGTPAVITSMRELSMLHTASFHIERVIDLRDRQSHLFGLVESEDALLLVAAGDVSAGVDLSQLREEDVVIDATSRTATVRLPPATVLSATLDNQATYVHTRRTDTLARRQETLETRARTEAERTLREAALAGGILQRAEEGAERTIRSLIRSFGFEVVDLHFRAE